MFTQAKEQINRKLHVLFIQFRGVEQRWRELRHAEFSGGQ